MNLINLTRSSLIATLLIAITGCSGEAETTATESQNNKLVKTITLSSEDRGGFREFPAVVEASEDATLAFRVSGELNSLNVTAGQHVEAGDILAGLVPDIERTSQLVAEISHGGSPVLTPMIRRGR